MEARIRNGYVQICEGAKVLNEIGVGNAVEADVNSRREILIRLNTGRVEIRNENGVLLQRLGVLCVEKARFVEDGILIRFPKSA